jgi:hypothetical protein
VEAKGFKTETRTGIVLNVNDDLKINIALQVGAITDTVEVKSQAVAVGSLARRRIPRTIEGVQVRELSLSTRNYEQLVSLMPGVTANSTDQLYIGNSSPAGTAATLPYSINGNRNSANNWTIDGADNVDRGSDLTLMMFPSVDSIAEFKVERSLYTADTGRAAGAQINVVTKSGTNQYHGDLYEFVRNNAFEANNWINNATSVLVNGSRCRCRHCAGTILAARSADRCRSDKRTITRHSSSFPKRRGASTLTLRSFRPCRRRPCCRAHSPSRFA